MTYLLDSHVCAALLRGKPPQVRRRFERTLGKGATLLLSSVVVEGLWHAVGRSERPEAATRLLEEFLAGPFEWTPFTDEDARTAGLLRAALQEARSALGAHDAMLAGQALARGAILVTANVREFERVEGLKWEDWGKAGR